MLQSILNTTYFFYQRQASRRVHQLHVLAVSPSEAPSSASLSFWPPHPWMEPGSQISLLKQKAELQIRLNHFCTTWPAISLMQSEALASAVTYDFSPESLCNLHADCDCYRYIPCACFYSNYCSLIKENSSIIVALFHFQMNHTIQFCISALLGFCLNGLTIISFRKIKELRTPSNLLVVSIALADCGICINAFIAAFSSFLRYVFFFLKVTRRTTGKLTA